ncbi:MAG: RNA polymerase subunit sigma-24 [Gemmatimonadetes bacterium]|nr:MAG: RNA polymerase subunit sigma-24 [Gemmatimonadota bacterium]PYP64230.1 MAG: RNA polymerase subunit sigma-24 [Gemmatimonadota bacterium]
MPDLTDRVRRAQDGDETAFRELYDEHAGRIYALCLRLTGDAATAQERTQDAFVRAWERLRSFRGDSAFGTWLHRLAVNVVLMERRGRSRRERRVTPASGEAAFEGASGGPPAPGERLDLEGAIAALPAGAREVFVLFDVEGYSHEEIAGMCGIAVGTSKAQLFRARRLLREMLER